MSFWATVRKKNKQRAENLKKNQQIFITQRRFFSRISEVSFKSPLLLHEAEKFLRFFFYREFEWLPNHPPPSPFVFTKMHGMGGGGWFERKPPDSFLGGYSSACNADVSLVFRLLVLLKTKIQNDNGDFKITKIKTFTMNKCFDIPMFCVSGAFTQQVILPKNICDPTTQKNPPSPDFFRFVFFLSKITKFFVFCFVFVAKKVNKILVGDEMYTTNGTKKKERRFFFHLRSKPHLLELVHFLVLLQWLPSREYDYKLHLHDV